MRKKSQIILNLVILLALFIVMMGGNLTAIVMGERMIRDEVNGRIEEQLSTAASLADSRFGSVQAIAENFKTVMLYNLANITDINSGMEQFLSVNSSIYGIAVGFEKNAMKAGHPGGAWATFNIGEGRFEHLDITAGHSFRDKPWYADAMARKEGAWALPFFDSRGEYIMSYCIPVEGKDGKNMGVVACDVAIDGLDVALESAKTFKNSTISVIGADGSLISESTNRMVPRKKDKIMHMEQRIQSTGWLMCVDIPESVVFASTRKARVFWIINFIIAVLIFSYICFRLIRTISDIEDATARESVMGRDLQTANHIQMAMLPKIFPAFPDRTDLDVYASIKPAKAVGGDLYDFVIDGDDIYFCIGDVSGKGVPASLLMAIVRSLFHNIAVREQSPARIANELNRAIAENNADCMFVTMFIGRCNLATGDFWGCNCGHNPPASNADLVDMKTMTVAPVGKARFVTHFPTNIPVGLMDGFEYKEVYMHLAHDVKLLLYTDGVTEAENAAQDLFGDERLLKILDKCGDPATPKMVIDSVLEEVSRFTGGAAQNDDITALCFHYTGGVPFRKAEA